MSRASRKLKRNQLRAKSKRKSGLVGEFFAKVKQKLSDSPTVQKLMKVRFIMCFRVLRQYGQYYLLSVL